MVYTCQHCGAWFPKDLLFKAQANSDKIIACPYCGLITEMDTIKTSHVTKGYDCLEMGDFYSAAMEFSESLKASKGYETSLDSKFLDAYLGRALAQHSVQVIYDEEIADSSTVPEINCYICNNSFLEESYDYQNALQIARKITDETLRDQAITRVTQFATKIDGIKRVYDRKEANKEEYQLFIACEDRSKDAEAGLIVANRIRDNMPDSIKKIYVQDAYGLSDNEYEGALLYAIHHSTCMLVVVDDDPDARLMNLYSRYYWAMKTADTQKELGFVRYKSDVQIHLPEHQISDKVFKIDDVPNYRKFVLDANKIFSRTIVVPAPGATQTSNGSTSTPATPTSITPDIPKVPGAPIVKGRICRFGSYPQSRVLDERIIADFTAEPKPTMSSENGWEVMFRSRSGMPYTWYKDKVIGGKKYRAVYFVKFREVFTVRATDIAPSLQRMSKYTPMKIYVFSYDTIEWNILDIARNSVTLVASVGLDCREFNNCALCSSWEESSIRTWLNEDFFNVAFDDDQKKFLWHNADDESVTILDSDLDIGNKNYRDRLNSYNIAGSDYFRCIGGFCDRSISNFWIKAPNDCDDRASVAQPHSMSLNNIVSQCVDNTAVSVLPIIRVNTVS